MAITNVNNRKKRKKSMIIVICAILAVFIIGAPMLMGKMSPGTAGYLAQTSETGTISTYYTFSGNVASAETQNIMAENILQIQTIHVKEGDKVEADTVLFTTNDGTEITSKMSGTVNTIMVEEDQQVMSGSQLAEIIDFDDLEITVKVDEYDLDAIEPNKEVNVNIGALDKDVKGTISEISRTAVNENGVSYFLATIGLEADKEIKIGMSAEASIQKDNAKDVVTVAMKALSFDEENNPYVYVYSEKEGMRKHTIVTGINDGKNIEIKSGLNSGQTVYYVDPNAVQGSGSSFLPPIGQM